VKPVEESTHKEHTKGNTIFGVEIN